MQKLEVDSTIDRCVDVLFYFYPFLLPYSEFNTIPSLPDGYNIAYL